MPRRSMATTESSLSSTVSSTGSPTRSIASTFLMRICFRIRIGIDRRADAKNWLLELDLSVRDNVLDSHAVPPDAFSLLNTQNDAFLERRMELFGQLEREFMEEVRVTPPGSTDPAPSPIDTDDEPPLDLAHDL